MKIFVSKKAVNKSTMRILYSKKFLENSLRLWEIPFPIMLQTFFNPRPLQTHSNESTLRALGHSGNRALKHLATRGTRGALYGRLVIPYIILFKHLGIIWKEIGILSCQWYSLLLIDNESIYVIIQLTIDLSFCGYCLVNRVFH